MKSVFLLNTVIGDEGTLAADQEHAFDDAEADRLIAIGAAVDPSTRIVEVPADAADVVTMVALQADVTALTAALDAAQSTNADLASALSASHAEIATLTKSLADATAKKK